MTIYRPIYARKCPNGVSRSYPAAIAHPSPEFDAILAGVRAGDAALARFDATGVLTLFTEVRRSNEATLRLEALRNYAELRRALLWRGQAVPATSLAAAGFTAAQIANFDAKIAAIPSCTGIPSVDHISPRAIGNRAMSSDAVQSERNVRPWRPGWTEAVVGLIVTAIIGFGMGSQIHRLGFDSVTYGQVLAGWSGFSCLAGFAAAWMIRKRPLASFGLRSTSRRWLLIGIAAGLVAFVAKGAAVVAFIALTGIDHSPQGVYAAGGNGGILSLVIATLLIGVLVPLGEELLFRGVLTTALLRYGPFVGVVGGALIFALLHGISIVFPAAVIQGLVAGEIYRRSGSLWPAVIVHVVYNLPTIPVMVLAGTV